MNVRTRGFNQNGVVIVSFTRTLLVYRQAFARFVLGASRSPSSAVTLGKRPNAANRKPWHTNDLL